ncbi:hypothetical protein JDV02_001034 [Purpureocillium takamizusanense]|uniref:DUF3074 domain-containing protein n=1 Tax=Purpureocillium takamizusanense TaxID=2060973 RepID=A0A9Q8V713_9HYPO|nr:uncharacterized protein JDV02_001034 [Purpureocillium takamizusanense]UNI14404.1 hypothetical protein JDV02_001034 [Purpureocillium takamizusanense]
MTNRQATVFSRASSADVRLLPTVFQLSAQFPGPTSPRDFITLLLTTDAVPGRPQPPAQQQQQQQQREHHGRRPLRQYMVVSKPCTHPGCPPRQGIIRGQYESVEIIREVPSEGMAAKRSFSHADLTSDDATRRVSFAKPPSGDGDDGGDDEGAPRAVEWLMVTRSDPGGSVPRFMIEKGTPPGIVGDAGKFLKWLTAMDPSQASESGAVQRNGGEKQNLSPSDARARTSNQQQTSGAASRTQGGAATADGNDDYDEGIPSSNGIYGIIAGAFGAATSVAYGLRQQFSSPLGFSTSQESVTEEDEASKRADAAEADEGDGDNGSESDASSTHSFSSAMERYMTADMGGDSVAGSHSDESRSQSKAANGGSSSSNPLDKELLKLTERRRKLDENYARMQERLESRRQDGKDKDAVALAKAREKHDRELAKQEAKYRREMRKLEEKRESEERKAEARRRKTAEREDRAALQLELDRARADRDVARKQLELLQGQVGELQRENTMLVARLGRLGAINNREDSASSRELSVKSLGKSDRALSS